jgi:membrane protein DedA with SNARE-associated domain
MAARGTAARRARPPGPLRPDSRISGAPAPSNCRTGLLHAWWALDQGLHRPATRKRPGVHLLGLLNFTNLVATAGYGAVFALCVLQSCCVPTSSELTLGFAGVLAAQGKLSLGLVIGVGVLGEVVGAYVAWLVGRYAGRAVVERYGRFALLSHRDLDRAEAWYGRHQRFGVFGSRLLPVIRNFVALPAGIAQVPAVRFGLLTAGGSILWISAWAGIGYGLGSRWHSIASGFGDAGYILAVVAVGVVCLALYHRYRSYKAGGARTPMALVPVGTAESEPHPAGAPIAAWEAAVRASSPRRA